MKINFYKKIFFTFLTLVFLISIFEISCRLYFSAVREGYNETAMFRAHPFKAFELNPNQNKLTDQTNSLGLRNKEISSNKEKNSIRILCLGASTTYSSGAKNIETTYPAYLEKILNDSKKDTAVFYEVINAGIPAYTFLQNLIDYQTRLIDFQPDILILMAGLNDATMIMNNINFKNDYSHYHKSFNISPPAVWEYSAALSFLFRNFISPYNKFIKNRNYALADIISQLPLKKTYKNPFKFLKKNRLIEIL